MSEIVAVCESTATCSIVQTSASRAPSGRAFGAGSTLLAAFRKIEAKAANGYLPKDVGWRNASTSAARHGLRAARERYLANSDERRKATQACAGMGKTRREVLGRLAT